MSHDPPPSEVPSVSPSSALRAGLPGGIPRWLRFDSLEPLLFEVWAGLLVLLSARHFVWALQSQTGGEWSAPLDATFLAFDQGRATARGDLLAWGAGGGPLANATSLTYPFVVALGYRLGFREGGDQRAHLMQWALGVACLCVFVFLRVAATAAREHGLVAKWLVPPAVLSAGAVSARLWSGVDEAWGLSVWAAWAWPLLRSTSNAPGGLGLGRAAGLAGLGVLWVATRLEGSVCVLASVPLLLARRVKLGPLALATAPPLAVTLGLTWWRATAGSWATLASRSALESAGRAWHTMGGLVADAPRWGLVVAAVALVPAALGPARANAVFLWAQVVGWCVFVALSRSPAPGLAIPAAWLLVLLAMGAGALVGVSKSAASGEAPPSSLVQRPAQFFRLAARVAVAVAVVALVAVHQVPTWRAEAWRFARASRNLRDREVTMGKTIGAFPGVERLLVATGPGGGATIAFAADRPAVDLVGVSAHRALPFHRAATQGAGATLELLERLGARDRPNVLVFDPDQWPEVAAIFGRRLFGVASAGNILTSSPELVAYRADWSSFDPSSQPHGLAKGERVHDELDVGDLLSEAAHGWSGAAGVVWWRVLPEVDGAVGEVFDGGRSLSPGTRATATLAIPPGGGRLVARLLASQSPKVHVSVAGVGTDLDDLALGSEVVAPSDSSRRGFSQASFALPRGLPSPSTLVFSVEGEAQLHHVWVVAASAR